MKLIVGLGNPGTEYAKTRHNAGFMVLDHLAQRHGLAGPKSKFRSGVLDGVVAGCRCLLVEPMTYMNRSGLAVGEVAQFYKLDPESELLVVVDDVALPAGQIRIRHEGGTGGHNGLADIQRALGTRRYPRLRIGIDPPGRIVQADYVLGAFTPEQRTRLEPAIGRACDAIECWLNNGIEAAMNRYNVQVSEGDSPQRSRD